MKWPWRRRPMDCEANQNVRSKLNLELGARIMNSILSFEPLWVVSGRTKTGLGKNTYVLEGCGH